MAGTPPFPMFNFPPGGIIAKSGSITKSPVIYYFLCKTS